MKKMPRLWAGSIALLLFLFSGFLTTQSATIYNEVAANNSYRHRLLRFEANTSRRLARISSSTLIVSGLSDASLVKNPQRFIEGISECCIVPAKLQICLIMKDLPEEALAYKYLRHNGFRAVLNRG